MEHPRQGFIPTSDGGSLIFDNRVKSLLLKSSALTLWLVTDSGRDNYDDMSAVTVCSNFVVCTGVTECDKGVVTQ